MPLEEIIARPITGIKPFNELPVDAEIWREAHDHHHLHRQLHGIAAHRPGIVFGLEVVASQTKGNSVVVAPGVGVDEDGQTVVLSEAVPFTLEERGQIYITLSFLRTADRNSAVTVGGGQQYFRTVEGRDVKATKELPATAYLELARIYRTSATAAVKDAKNPFDPGNDELSLLNRRVAFPHCYADVAVGELSYVPKNSPTAWKPNRAGLVNLLREGNGRGFHVDFSGPINLRAQNTAQEPALLYVAGKEGFQALADAEIEGLRRFLASGGLLWGEASGGSEDFGTSFQDLAGKLGATLKPIGKAHPLLSAHHMFSAPPPGAQEKGAVTGDAEAGVFFSTFDYGGAWQGEVAKADASNARDHIRTAQEFGLNIIAYAANRRRLRELARYA